MDAESEPLTCSAVPGARVAPGTALSSEAVYHEYQGMVRSVVFRMLHARAAADHAAVDDLVQDVFVKILSKMGKFRGEASLKTWIYRLAVNHIIDVNRRHKWWRWLGMETVESHPSEDNPGRDIEHDETSRLLRTALDGLSERHRSVIVLHYFESLPVGEIAAVLGITPGTVKSRLHYARNRLAQELEKNGVTL